MLSFERGQPKNKLNASVNWKLGALGATVRATRYGEALSPNALASRDVVIAAQTLVDLEARYALSSRLNVALGVENAFDRYPDSVPLVLNPTGNTPYPNYTPYGRSGRFVYGRASYSF